MRVSLECMALGIAAAMSLATTNEVWAGGGGGMDVPAPPLASGGAASGAAQEVSQLEQAESRDPYGRITVESALIHLVACTGGARSGRQYYIYQYRNRPGFRAILPPDWGHALGGRDLPSYGQALGVA